LRIRPRLGWRDCDSGSFREPARTRACSPARGPRPRAIPWPLWWSGPAGPRLASAFRLRPARPRVRRLAARGRLPARHGRNASPREIADSSPTALADGDVRPKSRRSSGPRQSSQPRPPLDPYPLLRPGGLHSGLCSQERGCLGLEGLRRRRVMRSLLAYRRPTLLPPGATPGPDGGACRPAGEVLWVLLDPWIGKHFGLVSDGERRISCSSSAKYPALRRGGARLAGSEVRFDHLVKATRIGPPGVAV